MADRYFVETPIVGDRAVLEGSEAHHLARVMRGRPGDRITLFDGSGVEFTAEVTRMGRDEVELIVAGREYVDRELSFRLTLAVALPKGDRQRWLVEKSVELGVARVIPLETARSVARPTAGAIRRMARWVVDASKQCGRNRLMEIAECEKWHELLAGAAEIPLRILAHPTGQNRPSGGETSLARFDVGAATAQPREAIAAIGPEGGWTDEEVAAALRAGWRTIDLGPRILRVETAAVVIPTLLAAAFIP